MVKLRARIKFILSVAGILSILYALLLSPAFGPSPVLAAKARESGYFENEYGRVGWETSLSKEVVTRNEEFYATVNLTSTIKKIPEGYESLINLANSLNVVGIVSYQVLGKSNQGGRQVVLYQGKISKDLPKIKAGSPFLELQDERIPSNGELVFPGEAEYENYDLFIKLTKIEAKVVLFPFTFTKDITGLARNFLPPEAFETGIKLGSIRYSGVIFSSFNFILTPDEGLEPLSITASVEVSNTGSEFGSYIAQLKVNDEVVETKAVEIAPGAAESIDFSYKLTEPGTYQVAINDLEPKTVTVLKSLYRGANPILYTGATTSLPEALTNIKSKTAVIWARGIWTGGEWWFYLVEWGVGQITRLEKGKVYIVVTREDCGWRLP